MNRIYRIIPLQLISLMLLLGGCETMQEAKEKLIQMTASEKQAETPDSAKAHSSAKKKLKETPPHDPIQTHYQTLKASNVRGGPGMDYKIIAHLKQDARVWVKGKVKQRNWYIISLEGQGDGYLHTSLARQMETAKATDATEKETSPIEEQTQLTSGKLSAEKIGNLLIGNTVTLVEEISHKQSIEYYQNTNQLIHYEDGETSSGHWKISGTEVGQFCRYWMSANKKMGRCYHLIAGSVKLHFLPVFKSYGLKQRIFFDSISRGDQIKTNIQELK